MAGADASTAHANVRYTNCSNLMSFTIGAPVADISPVSPNHGTNEPKTPVTRPGDMATRLVQAYAKKSLPLSSRVWSWTATGAMVAAILVSDINLRVALMFWCFVLLGIHAALQARELRRASAMIPALTELEDFPADGDQEVLALAMTRLCVSGSQRLDRDAPAAALAAMVQAVMTEADGRSCAQGHTIGCAHRRTTSWWDAWLSRHSRPVPQA